MSSFPLNLSPRKRGVGIQTFLDSGSRPLCGFGRNDGSDKQLIYGTAH